MFPLYLKHNRRKQNENKMIYNCPCSLSIFHKHFYEPTITGPQKYPDSKVHGANMGPTWVLSAIDGPHVGSTNLAIRVYVCMTGDGAVKQYVLYISCVCVYLCLYVRIYITVTSWWPLWRLKSPASPLFTQSFIQTQIKENIKAPRRWPLCGNSPGTGEFPAQMASNVENISIWWHHHGLSTA